MPCIPIKFIIIYFLSRIRETVNLFTCAESSTDTKLNKNKLGVGIIMMIMSCAMCHLSLFTCHMPCLAHFLSYVSIDFVYVEASRGWMEEDFWKRWQNIHQDDEGWTSQFIDWIGKWAILVKIISKTAETHFMLLLLPSFCLTHQRSHLTKNKIY